MPLITKKLRENTLQTHEFENNDNRPSHHKVYANTISPKVPGVRRALVFGTLRMLSLILKSTWWKS